jgi:hypothetical protein
VLVAVLVVVTALLAVGATAALWAQRTLLDTDRFAAVAGPVLDDPAVTEPLADVISDAVVDTLAIERLPSFVADFLEEQVVRLVDGAVASPAVRDRLPGLVLDAHAGVVGLVRGEGDDRAGVALTEDGIVLETRPAVVAALEDLLGNLGDAARLLPDLVVPQGAGRMLLVRTDALDGVQRFVTGVDTAVPLLLAGAAVGLVVTLVLARRRVRALALLGLTTAAVAAGAALYTPTYRDSLVDRVPNADLRRAIGALLEPLGADLVSTLWTVAAAAAGVGVLAGLATVALALARNPDRVRGSAAGRTRRSG